MTFKFRYHIIFRFQTNNTEINTELTKNFKSLIGKIKKGRKSAANPNSKQPITYNNMTPTHFLRDRQEKTKFGDTYLRKKYYICKRF